MAEYLITREAAAAHVREHCPNRIELPVFGRWESDHVCGCGHCPQPDPSPAEYRRQVEEAIWQASQRALDDGERDHRWIRTELVRG